MLLIALENKEYSKGWEMLTATAWKVPKISRQAE